MPASTDYWINDRSGDPLLVMTGEVDAALTKVCDDGHQTQVITSRSDLSDIEVAYRMFERWRQENFFKRNCIYDHRQRCPQAHQGRPHCRGRRVMCSAGIFGR
jgi:hypothetical protein